MGGVPSNRGCEACRHKRKKCDLGQPSCRRCLRQGIECIGSGQRRFMFRHVTAPSDHKGQTNVRSNTPRQALKLGPGPKPSRPLSSDTTRAMTRFVSTLSSPDVRFNMRCFGGAWEELVRRIPDSAALESSTRAVTSAIMVHSSCAQRDRALVDYGESLSSLGEIIVTAGRTGRMAEALAAVSLTMLTHHLLGGGRAEYDIHMHGLMHILNYVPVQACTTDFEKNAFEQSCFVAILESLHDPAIYIGPQLASMHLRRRLGPPPAANIAHGVRFYSLQVENLIMIPCYLQDPCYFRADMAFLYERMLFEAPLMGKIASATAEAAAAADPADGIQPFTNHVMAEVGYSLLGCVALVLNYTLRMLCHGQSAVLARECNSFVTDIVRSVERLTRYRPIGNSRAIHGLAIAWVVTTHPAQKLRVRSVIEDCRQDFLGLSWEELAKRYKSRLEGVRDKVRSQRHQVQGVHE